MATKKFEDVAAAVKRGAKAVIGLNTYNGEADLPKFEAKYGADEKALHYAQTRVWEKGVKYVTHTRLGC